MGEKRTKLSIRKLLITKTSLFSNIQRKKTEEPQWFVSFAFEAKTIVRMLSFPQEKCFDKTESMQRGEEH